MFFVVRVGGLNGSSQGGEDRGGVGVLDRERGHQIGGLIARELRGRSCRGSGLVLVRQSFIDIGPNGWTCFGTRILIAAALQ